MSTLRVNKLENTNTSNGGISIDTSGHVSIDGQQLPSSGPLSNRNLIINGAMTVSQRSTSSTNQTASAYGPCDRYKALISNLGTHTIEQDTDAPAGFSNSLKVDCTTADASPAAGDFLFIRYIAEAQDLQQLGIGTADAKELTMSFWVKSNKTGDASFMLNSPDGNDRSFITTYNIAAANTWEYKTISIPADTGGTINNDNGSGFEIEWWLNSGSTFTGTTPNAGWAARVNSARNNSNLGIAGSTDDYWQITGVQLEVGSVATPFEHRSYSDELVKCQRYFISVHDARLRGIASSSTGLNRLGMTLPTTMRTAPCCAPLTGTLDWYDGSNVGGITSFNTLYATQDSVELDCTVNSGTTAAQRPIAVYIGNNGNALEISAEL